MATVQRYVNTAADGTGDGTTNATTGANGAYASLSAWEAAAGGSATDDYIVDCCGTAAETTAVTIDFAVGITTGSITIRGNRSDAAGFYDGNLVISDQHYRLTHGAGTSGISCSETNITIDGIQISSSGGDFRSAIAPIASNGNCTVKNCRLRAAAATNYGIGRSGAYGATGTFTYENNLVVGFNVDQIQCWSSTHTSTVYNVHHNTLYGDGSSTGIKLTQVDGAGSPTYNIKGNASANSGTGNDYDASAMLEGGATVNLADNAFSEAAGTTDEIVLGTTTDAWTSPGTLATSDFTVKDTSSSLYNAVNPTLLSEDITEFTRDGTNHDVGAFEFQDEGGGEEGLAIPIAMYHYKRMMG